NQAIYVRVDSDIDNGCLGLGPYVNLTIDPVPTADPVGNLELCDDLADGDGTNGIATTFDLDSQTATILGTQDPANYTVSYHASQTDANTGNNSLSSPYTNTTPNLQTIYIRVTNNTTNCFTDHTTFDLIVHPLPIANFVGDLEVCDDDLDGSARNGFSQNIDLESQTPTILGSQDPTIYSVTYHKSLAQAQAGTNPLPSPFSNQFPYRETIYIRVSNNQTMCINGISNFDVIINPEPTTETVSNLSYCDDDTDGNDMNGIIQSIDLDSQIEALLGTNPSDPTTQQPDDFNVTFHHSQAEATSGANPIASPYTNTNTTETIFVRVQNKATMCVNDDASFQVIVNPLPNFSVKTPDIACLNLLPKFISIIRPSDVYTYEWRNPNGDLISTTDTAQVSVVNGQVVAGNYTVKATTTDGTMCSRERVVEINTSNIATITEEDVTIIDQSNTTNNDNLSIQINNNNQNLGIGNYQYALEDENGILIRNYQDEPLFENLEGGIYTILVNDKNGCGTVRLLVSVLQFPKFFTPNFDGRNDTWVIKGANTAFYPQSSINIFNRYGKIIAQVELDSQGWDGTYNGKVLPSDDYWFHIQLVPANTNRNPITKKGHFSLLRR
ncbi:MAG: T9SS type B sorting domain-containing protein, partial [Polaribacter sp.]